MLQGGFVAECVKARFNTIGDSICDGLFNVFLLSAELLPETGLQRYFSKDKESNQHGKAAG
jgi:hypothetical protein